MIKPYKKMVLIKPDDAKEMTDGGIIIPEKAQKKVVTGKVLSVANDVSCVKAGDKVYYSKWAGISVEDGLIVKETDVMGVFVE